MLPEVKGYLATVKSQLRLDPACEGQILRELSTHFEERLHELCEAGLPEAKAAEVATECFGNPKAVAREMYEVHSKGSWIEALLAALPHLMVALFFILHLWGEGNWLLVGLVSMVCIAAYGWWHGKPTWFYPWLGYSLAALVIGGLVSSLLIGDGVSLFLVRKGSWPHLWAWLAIAVYIVYIPLALWLLASILIRTVRRDWIYASLMVLPLPILARWLLTLPHEGSFLDYNEQRLHEADPRMALTFVALAVSAATFVRLRWRLLKIGALIMTGLAILVVGSLGDPDSFDLLGLLLMGLLLVGFLLSPALLELRVGHGEAESGVWNDAWLGQAPSKG